MTQQPRCRPESGADLETVVRRLGMIGEAYSQLPGWARTPPMQRRFIIASLREIEWACECKAVRDGYAYQGERLRFYHVLIHALMQLEKGGSLPTLFARPSDEVRTRQDDRNRNSLQAWAAAILDASHEHCHPKGRKRHNGQWAAKIATAVSAAGLGGGKSRRDKPKLKAQLTASTVEKWLKRCKAGTHPAATIYAVRKESIRTQTFLAADVQNRSRLLDGQIDELGDAICMVFGPQDGRSMNTENRRYINNFCRLAFGSVLDDEALGNLGVEFP